MIQEPHHVISSSIFATNSDGAGLSADDMYHSSDEVIFNICLFQCAT